MEDTKVEKINIISCRFFYKQAKCFLKQKLSYTVFLTFAYVWLGRKIINLRHIFQNEWLKEGLLLFKSCVCCCCCYWCWYDEYGENIMFYFDGEILLNSCHDFPLKKVLRKKCFLEEKTLKRRFWARSCKTLEQ